MLPVLSYIILRGKCRQCRSHITLRYPLVEAITGLLFLACYIKFGISWTLVSRLVFICFLIVIALIDLENLIIPNIIVFPGALAGLLLTFLSGSPSWFSGILSGLGAGLFFFLIWFFYPAGMGEGDVKLVLMLGLFLGWPGIGIAIFLSALAGSVAGGISIALKGSGRKTQIPFGLYLAIGSTAALFFGDRLVTWYLNFLGIY